jgi:hypothetical protein
VDDSLRQAELMRRRHCRVPAPRSAFAGFRFPPEVIIVAVRWYLRYALCYRDVEELVAERGIEVDHVTVLRWVQRFTPLLIDAARPCRHAPGDRWFADHGRLKSRLRPMRGLKRLRSTQVISAGHAFVQNHRGHYELGFDLDPRHRLPTAFAELAHAIRPGCQPRLSVFALQSTQQCRCGSWRRSCSVRAPRRS